MCREPATQETSLLRLKFGRSCDIAELSLFRVRVECPVGQHGHSAPSCASNGGSTFRSRTKTSSNVVWTASLRCSTVKASDST